MGTSFHEQLITLSRILQCGDMRENVSGASDIGKTIVFEHDQ